MTLQFKWKRFKISTKKIIKGIVLINIAYITKIIIYLRSINMVTILLFSINMNVRVTAIDIVVQVISGRTPLK